MQREEINRRVIGGVAVRSLTEKFGGGADGHHGFNCADSAAVRAPRCRWRLGRRSSQAWCPVSERLPTTDQAVWDWGVFCGAGDPQPTQSVVLSRNPKGTQEFPHPTGRHGTLVGDPPREFWPVPVGFRYQRQ